MREYEIDLDMAKEPPDTDAEIEAAARRYGVEARLLKRCGPGGGWPQWLFRGTRAALRKFVVEWYAGGDEDVGEDALSTVEGLER